MSTLFMRCTLEDPKNEFDVRIERNSQGSNFLQFDGGYTADESSKVTIYGHDNYQGDLHPQLYDVIKVEIEKDDTNPSTYFGIGYIRAAEIKYLAPFYKANKQNLFSAKIHRLNPEIGGSAGITISIYID